MECGRAKSYGSRSILGGVYVERSREMSVDEDVDCELLGVVGGGSMWARMREMNKDAVKAGFIAEQV